MKRDRLAGALTLGVSVIAFIAGCAATGDRASAARLAPASVAAGALASGDAVVVQRRGAHPSEDIAQIVDRSGQIALPFLGRVSIAGYTTAEAEKLIEKMYVEGGYYRDPDVTIVRVRHLDRMAAGGAGPDAREETDYWTPEDIREWEQRTGDRFPGAISPSRRTKVIVRGDDIIRVYGN